MRATAFLLVASACYAPTFPTGQPCDKDRPCPSALVCAGDGTCQLPSYVPDVDAGIDAEPTPDACVPVAEICDDGIDQDCLDGDVSCAQNDGPSGAVDVTMGGTFSADLTLANDDLGETGCDGAGGADVFFRVTINGPRVYYFDTFGTDFDTTLRVYPGVACGNIAAQMPSCSNDACGGDASQLAVRLPPGQSCIVVDRAAGDTGDLALRVIRGARDGSPLGDNSQTKIGDTCERPMVDEPSDPDCTSTDESGPDVAWYFTACPGQTRHLDASTCADVTMVHYDTVLYVSKEGVAADLACRDDSSSCAPRPDRPDHADGAILTDINAVGPGLFWLTLDGYDDGACGEYHVVTNLD